MTETEFVTVTITGPDADSLLVIVRALVEARLAACGNVIPGVTSVYRWEGTVEQEPEAIALIHTRHSLISPLASLTISLHPYDVPQISWSPLEATGPYETWVEANTLSSTPRQREQEDA